MSTPEKKSDRSTQTDEQSQNASKIQLPQYSPSCTIKMNKKVKYRVKRTVNVVGTDGVSGSISRVNKTKTKCGFQLHPHPLLIPNIISQIVSYLPFQDLKVCRQVSQLWNDEVLKYLLPNTKIFLDSFESVSDFISRYGDRRDKFVYFKLGSNLNLQDNVVQKFFAKVGPSMKSLHLDKPHWIPASLRKILFERLLQLDELVLCTKRSFEDIRLYPPNGNNQSITLPSVKILQIDVSFERTNGLFLADLVSAMPNLRRLSRFKSECPSNRPKVARMGTLRYDQFDSYVDTVLFDPDLDVTFARLLITRRDLRLPFLTNLKFVFDFDSLTILRQRNYPLQRFELVVPGSSFLTWQPRPSVIHNFLLSLSTTLTYSAGRPKLFTSFDSIGRLRCLNHLYLHRVSGPLDFLNSLPNLKTLIMTQEEFIEHYDEFNIDEGRAHKLHTLKLYYTHWSASSVYSELTRAPKMLNVVQNIVLRFPNLKCLRMETLTDKCLGVIYTSLPQLEELEATNGIFTSVGISGIPVVHQGALSPITRKQPYIGQLRDLKRLRLESNKMTDFAVVSSIQFLNTLEELALLCYKLSDESLLIIVNKLRLNFLRAEFCYEFSKEAIFQAKNTMIRRGRIALLNEFCGTLEIEQIHEFLNENGPVHVSLPEFPH